MSKPSSSEKTIQADVGPGDETGIYYITICNLPFGSTWQELKDWLRQACTVDHIELFQTSTSGWIRLRGKDNFEKAWKHINIVTFNGRSIIASDKNRTESIKIKELVESSSHSKSARSSPALRSPYSQTTPSVRHGPQSASRQYSAASYGQVFMREHQQNNPGARYSTSPIPTLTAYNNTPHLDHTRPLVNPYSVVDPWTSFSTGTAPGLECIEQGCTDKSTTSQSPYGSFQYALPYQSRPGTTSYGNIRSSLTELFTSRDNTPSEARKILITTLSLRASPGETSSWIRRKAGPFASEISDIKIPRLESKNRIRGHAYVIFKTTAAAQGSLNLLDRAVFHGLAVSARIIVERAAENPASLSDTFCKISKESHEGESKKQRMKPKESGSSGYQGGSIRKPDAEKTKATDDPKREQVENEKKEWPVIADGSSRRRVDKLKV